jgi:hypothetical protein
MFKYEIAFETLLIKDVSVADKHIPPTHVFTAVDVFDLTSKWNIDFKHPVVLL